MFPTAEVSDAMRRPRKTAPASLFINKFTFSLADSRAATCPEDVTTYEWLFDFIRRMVHHGPFSPMITNHVAEPCGQPQMCHQVFRIGTEKPCAMNA
ncbi:unnamed protein product [Nesidiocoris tenuis]|uniref:Uncharacterized protein n=1 Tax=Nesidiocoris tenuis TaxID=355587 RepID=A0A6H5H000_9HEMI|nr:unnamed protein product [Nesidiocoris tenuis]